MGAGTWRDQLVRDGFAVFPSVLSAQELADARDALDRAVERTRMKFGTTHNSFIDPNDANIRVNSLPAHDRLFRRLLARPDATEVVEAVLGPGFVVSNFSANIALPGSGSMRLHSDQALVVPPPWPRPWAMNIIWCLDDVHSDNGSTRYLPGSHRLGSVDEVPADAMAQTLPFEAPAGSFIAMEGRLWHTSGANITRDQQRRMMFAYYTADFVRQQMNWALVLPPEVQETFDEAERDLFGLTTFAKTGLAGRLISLDDDNRARGVIGA